MTTSMTPLRDLVAERLAGRWEAFAAEHPHLAAGIDRVRLVESSVTELRRDPAFRAALREADLDEAQLRLAARALERLELVLALQMPR